MRTTRLPPSLCPHCGYAMDAASALRADAVPEPGDWTVCLACGGVMQFDASLRPALPALGAYEALRLSHPQHHAAIERASRLAREQRRTDPIPESGGRA